MKIAIFVCKAMRAVLQKLGRGSSLPGAVALKLDRNILKKLQFSCPVVAVTGSNGKTGTTEMINRLAKEAGLKTVCNSEGSNQIEGVTASLLGACDFGGRIDADAIILESDERFCQYTFSNFTPTATVLGNLFRDQLTRNGHSEFVAKELKKGLKEGTIPVVNADDPTVMALARDFEKVLTYGVSPNAFSESPDTPHAYFDGSFCPVCGGRMLYHSRLFSHLGNYECQSCGFKRGEVTHEVTAFEGDNIVIDGRYTIKASQHNAMYAQNLVAAFTVATEILGIEPQKAAEVLGAMELKNSLIARVKSYELGEGKSLTFMLCKHENSMAYNQTINAIATENEAASVLLIVDKLSRKYVAEDMSWLWDLDFMRFKDERIKKVVLSGGFAHDLLSRALLEGVPAEKLVTEPDMDKALRFFRDEGEGELFALTCFTDAPVLRGCIRRLRDGK